VREDFVDHEVLGEGDAVRRNPIDEESRGEPCAGRRGRGG
jgi:hypothetical protein